MLTSHYGLPTQSRFYVRNQREKGRYRCLFYFISVVDLINCIFYDYQAIHYDLTRYCMAPQACSDLSVCQKTGRLVRSGKFDAIYDAPGQFLCFYKY